MNSLLTNPTEFATLVQRFFTERLLQQKNASPRTIAAYRDTFRMLLCYAEREIGKPPTKLALIDFDVTFILNFLTYLESERHNTIRTRNARLATLRAFAHYVALQCPEALLLTQQIQAIPMKRFEKPMLAFLSRKEIQTLLEAPDEQTWCGYRDRILLTLLYNTGARVSELIGIRVADVELTMSPSLRLHDKGRKQRTVPLWKETTAKIRCWLVFANLKAEQALIPTRRGLPMTRSNVAERITLAVNLAANHCPQLQGRCVTPHTLRHNPESRIMPSKI